MLFCQQTHKHIKNINLSQPNHPSLSKWSTVCTRQDLGVEHSILQYVTLMLHVNQVCHGASRCQNWELFFIKPRVKDNEQCCWDISQRMLDAIKRVTDLSFSTTVHQCIQQSKCCSAKLWTSFLLSYSPVTFQRLIPLTTRFWESYSSITISCE